MTRMLIAALVLVASATSVFAQELTVIEAIPTAQRQGTFQSGSYSLDVVPEVIDEQGHAHRFVMLRLDIPTSDYEDAANSAWFRFFVSNDGGASWIAAGAAKWVGGRVVTGDGVLNPIPTMTPSLPAGAGWIVRAEADIPRRMRAGLTIIY
jgi:hypothetical protein